MNFRTVIEPPRHLGYLDHRQHLLLLGSCFVENIGLWLQQRKFDVDINPFGTLYNPESIARNWERIVSGNSFTPMPCFRQTVCGTATTTTRAFRDATGTRP